MKIKIPILIVVVLVFFMAISNSCQQENKISIAKGASVALNAEFVGTQNCVSCHETEFKSWQDSHHDQAMKIADTSSILGDFNNTSFTHKGIKTTFFKQENKYLVNTQGKDGEYHDFEVSYTFGVTPLQQYLIKFKNGSVQCLLTAWDDKEKKWYHLQPELDLHHEEWMNWTGGSMTWNTMCADCHSTNLKKNFNAKTNSYHTTFSEINVGCEGCHGPASLHVDFYSTSDKKKIEKAPKLYMGKNMGSKEVVQKCARCHSRREQITPYFDYEGHFLDHYNPSAIAKEFYELDGQILEEDYVYSSFVQSKMYHNGVSCKDCHDVHGLKLKKTGNALCLNCHVPAYNSPSHHFHEVETDAALCVNCHMTGKIYMGNDFRRDHSFRIPRPDQTVEFNTPNACNSCHEDKTPEWASAAIVKNYGGDRGNHFSDYLLAGSDGNQEAYIKLFSDSKYPEIARARALNEYSDVQLSRKEINTLLIYLNDSSGLVRSEALLAFIKAGAPDYANNIAPLLQDSLRLVRIGAAKYFNITGVKPPYPKGFENANQEYLTSLNTNADFAVGQYNLGLYYEAKGDFKMAVKAFEKSIEIDMYFNASRINLALLLYNSGQDKKAEQLYLEIIKQEPTYGYSYYMLGLLYNETGKTEKAIEYLTIATEKEPPFYRAYYNLALVLQQESKNKESLKVVKKGLNYFADDQQLLYVKLIGELNLETYVVAKQTCSKLLKMDPTNSNFLAIMEKLAKY